MEKVRVGYWLPVALLSLMYLAGIILALIYLKRFGRPALFALVGCVILLLLTITAPIVTGQLMAMSHSDGTMDFPLRMGVVGIARTLFNIVGFSLVLAAVFMRRKQQQT